MKYAIGIDLGGTFIKYSVVDENSQIMFDGRIQSNADVSHLEILNQIEKAIDQCLKFAAVNSLCMEGIGIGTPGIVDKTNRIVLGGADNLKGWKNIYLADEIEKRKKIPTIIENDANIMGIAEYKFGAAKGLSDVLFITIGTGIGGAIFVDNKIFSGFNNCGSELGHIPFQYDGLHCSCGSVGCWEVYASTSAMVSRYKAMKDEITIENINGEYIIKKYIENEPNAIIEVERECDYIARGVAGLVNIFSPQAVVIGGGLFESSDFFIHKIQKRFIRYVMPDCGSSTKIMAAKLGNKAGVVGAASIVFSY